MEIMLLMSITGLVGLAVSTAMMYASFQPHPNDTENFDRQGRDDFFRKIKLKANQFR
ncbi:MAG: hypothetical protein R2822_04010 [Spirosomataceae bacterium]